MNVDILTKVTILYDSGEYAAAFRACVNFLKEDQSDNYEHKSELYETMALSSLLLLHTPLDDKANEMIYQCIGFAATESKDSDRIYNLKKRVAETFHKWKKDSAQYCLSELLSEMTLEKYKQYYHIWVKYSEMDLLISMAISSGCKGKEFNIPTFEGSFDKINEDQLEYETACKSFELTRRIFEENNNGNPNFILELIKKTLERLTVEELLLKTKEDSNIYLKSLKKQAEINNFKLSAVAYPNGKPFYLFYNDDTSQRKESIHELSDLYDKIQKLDPDFVIPELPPVGNTSTTSSSAQSTGGCYVATSVYGSYNCPQVWTLRRFRDETLAKTWYGRLFIHLYYLISPTLVRLFGKTSWFRFMWKPFLDKKVHQLNQRGVANTPYNDKKW